MDAVDTISSSSESKMNKMYTTEKVVHYECETDSDSDSENETIDVICENSDRDDKVEELKEHLLSSQKFSSIYGETSVIVPSKGFLQPKSVREIQCSVIKPDVVNSVINARSKTFLIDNILGNDNKAKCVSDEHEIYEENTDEHNGNYLMATYGIKRVIFLVYW